MSPPYATPMSLYEDPIFHALFWTKNICALIAYAGCIKTTIFVMHPSYYKPYRWFTI